MAKAGGRKRAALGRLGHLGHRRRRARRGAEAADDEALAHGSHVALSARRPGAGGVTGALTEGPH
eukprot:14133107-Alexandrium_andersonii.AAC.1